MKDKKMEKYFDKLIDDEAAGLKDASIKDDESDDDVEMTPDDVGKPVLHGLYHRIFLQNGSFTIDISTPIHCVDDFPHFMDYAVYLSCILVDEKLRDEFIMGFRADVAKTVKGKEG